MTSSRDDLTAALAAAVRDLTSLLPPERWHLLYPATAETIALVQDDDAMAALLAEDPPDRPPTAGEVLARIEVDDNYDGIEEWTADAGWSAPGWCCSECFAAAIRDANDDLDAPQPGLRLVPGEPEDGER